MQLGLVSEFKYLGCVLDELGSAEAECFRNPGFKGPGFKGPGFKGPRFKEL